MTGTPSSQKIDFANEVATAKSAGDTVADSTDVMDRVRTMTYTRISNMMVPSAQEMLAFTRKLKPELNTYLWFAKIYGTETEVARLRRDLHSVLAGKLDQISAEAGMSISMLGQYDPRVKGGTMTKYDYYVEYVEGIARQKGPTKPPAELPKPGIRLVQGVSPPTGDDDHALVGLPKIDDQLSQIQVLLTGALSKNPDGGAVLEKLSQLKSTLSETYFTKKSDDKEKKPISDSKSDSKSSDKKRKSSRKSESDSDSDEPTTKPSKKKSDATTRYTVAEFEKILKLANTPDAGNANANYKFKRKEKAMFATTSRKEIAPEAQDAISNTLKNKVREGLALPLALILRKATATSRIADTPMTKTVETVNKRSIDLLIYFVKKQSKKATAAHELARGSMASGLLAVKLAKRKQRENLAIS